MKSVGKSATEKPSKEDSLVQGSSQDTSPPEKDQTERKDNLANQTAKELEKLFGPPKPPKSPPKKGKEKQPKRNKKVKQQASGKQPKKETATENKQNADPITELSRDSNKGRFQNT